MNQSESNPLLRVLIATIDDASGNPLPSNFVWLDGMIKISKGGQSFASAENLFVHVAGGAQNAFSLQLETAETNTLGALVVQAFDAVGGELIGEWQDTVQPNPNPSSQQRSGFDRAMVFASGESAEPVCTVRSSDGSLVDLAGARIYFTARKRDAIVLEKRNTAAGGGDDEIEIVGLGHFKMKIDHGDTNGGPLQGECDAWIVAGSVYTQIVERAQFEITRAMTREFPP